MHHCSLGDKFLWEINSGTGNTGIQVTNSYWRSIQAQASLNINIMEVNSGKLVTGFGDTLITNINSGTGLTGI
jgi:hypothetical protein